MSPWAIGLARQTDVRIYTDSGTLRAPEAERQLSIKEQRMIFEESVERLFRGQAVIIVEGAQDQIMKFGKKIIQPSFDIESAEIETAVVIVEKELFPNSEM